MIVSVAESVVKHQIAVVNEVLKEGNGRTLDKLCFSQLFDSVHGVCLKMQPG